MHTVSRRARVQRPAHEGAASTPTGTTARAAGSACALRHGGRGQGGVCPRGKPSGHFRPQCRHTCVQRLAHEPSYSNCPHREPPTCPATVWTNQATAPNGTRLSKAQGGAAGRRQAMTPEAVTPRGKGRRARTRHFCGNNRGHSGCRGAGPEPQVPRGPRRGDSEWKSRPQSVAEAAWAAGKCCQGPRSRELPTLLGPPRLRTGLQPGVPVRRRPAGTQAGSATRCPRLRGDAPLTEEGSPCDGGWSWRRRGSHSNAANRKTPETGPPGRPSCSLTQEHSALVVPRPPD